MALIFALTAVVFVLLYLGPYRNPGWLSPGFAASLCLFGIAAFTTGEFIREAVRKPYVVNNVVLANQILPNEVTDFERRLLGGRHVDQGLCRRPHYPQVMVAMLDEDGRPAGPTRRELLKLPLRTIASSSGKVLFLHHCNDCHADVGLFRRRAAVAGTAAATRFSTDRTPRRHLLHAALVRHRRRGRAAGRLPDDHQSAAAAGRRGRGRNQADDDAATEEDP